MKRGDLERKLRIAGCYLKREGGSNSLWIEKFDDSSQMTFSALRTDARIFASPVLATSSGSCFQ